VGYFVKSKWQVYIAPGVGERFSAYILIPVSLGFGLRHLGSRSSGNDSGL